MGAEPDAGPPASAPTAFDVGLRGLCPRCGSPTLFAGMLDFAPHCRACDLDYDQFNVGDGPAAFLTFAIGAVVTIAAVWLELAVGPPWWVHALLWVPLTIGGVVATLRVGKGMLLALEYRNAAREGRLAGPDA